VAWLWLSPLDSPPPIWLPGTCARTRMSIFRVCAPPPTHCRWHAVGVVDLSMWCGARVDRAAMASIASTHISWLLTIPNLWCGMGVALVSRTIIVCVDQRWHNLVVHHRVFAHVTQNWCMIRQKTRLGMGAPAHGGWGGSGQLWKFQFFNRRKFWVVAIPCISRKVYWRYSCTKVEWHHS
jgi:hypothetical protein